MTPRPHTPGTPASVPGDSPQITNNLTSSAPEINLPGPTPARKTKPLRGFIREWETRTRTGDTTIFSRVLYQLSYLAVAAQEPSAVRATP